MYQDEQMEHQYRDFILFAQQREWIVEQQFPLDKLAWYMFTYNMTHLKKKQTSHLSSFHKYKFPDPEIYH